MIARWLENMADTILYLAFIFGLMFFFCVYWKEEYRIRYAEAIMEEFLVDISAEGKISMEDYEILIANLDRAVPDCEVKLLYTKYVPQPVYTAVSKEELTQYYLSRNLRNVTEIIPYIPESQEGIAENLCLQTETNATVLAAVENEYVPLPGKDESFLVEAVRPYQEIYEGEALVTLCRIRSPNGIYYAEAEQITAIKTGTVLLRLHTENGEYHVPVEVLLHPRQLTCSNGHCVVNSPEVLEQWKKTGVVSCFYCRQLPEYISTNVSLVQKETGTKLTGQELWFNVSFMDGHQEKITPESDGWQDTYDENYCGVQAVSVFYRGKETGVVIVSENSGCVQCGQACNERCFKDYLEFPYCVECMSQVPLFNGTVAMEERQISGNEIVTSLDENGEYILRSGDFVTLYLRKDGVYRSILQKEIRRTGTEREKT